MGERFVFEISELVYLSIRHASRPTRGGRWGRNEVALFREAEEVTPLWFIVARCSFTVATRICAAAPRNCGRSISVKRRESYPCVRFYDFDGNISSFQRRNRGISYPRARVGQQRGTNTRQCCTVMPCTFTVVWPTCKREATAGDGTWIPPPGACWGTNRDRAPSTATLPAGSPVVCWFLAGRAVAWPRTSSGGFISVKMIELLTPSRPRIFCM